MALSLPEKKNKQGKKKQWTKRGGGGTPGSSKNGNCRKICLRIFLIVISLQVIAVFFFFEFAHQSSSLPMNEPFFLFDFANQSSSSFSGKEEKNSPLPYFKGSNKGRKKKPQQVEDGTTRTTADNAANPVAETKQTIRYFGAPVHNDSKQVYVSTTSQSNVHSNIPPTNVLELRKTLRQGSHAYRREKQVPNEETVAANNPKDAPITIRFSGSGRSTEPEQCDVPCQAYRIRGGGTNHPLTVDGTDFHFPVYTMEGPQYHSIAYLPDDATRAIKNTTLYATTSYQSDIPLPYYSPDIYDIQKPAIDFDKVIKGASFIARNCNSKNNREGVVKALAKLMRVDSLSACLHNADPPNGLDMKNKTALMREYLFHLAFENQNYDDYITEKLWGTLQSGTLPVYLGPPNIREHLPHPDSVILVQDFETMEELATYLEKVSQNRTLYESHHAWRKHPLPESFHKKYDFTKIHSRCRICRFIYAKLHDDVVWNHDAQEIIRFPSAAEAAAAAPNYARKSPQAKASSKQVGSHNTVAAPGQVLVGGDDNVPPARLRRQELPNARRRGEGGIPVRKGHGAPLLKQQQENMPPPNENASITVRFDGGTHPEQEHCDVPCRAYRIRGGGTNHRLTIDGTPFHFPVYTMEGPQYHPEAYLPDDHQRATRNTTFYATTSYQSDIPLPYYSPDIYNIQEPAIDFDKAIKGASFIARNCASKNNREGVVKELTHLMRVDSLSSCLHNANPPNGLNMHSKPALMREYLFHLAFENQNYDDYITEKLWETLQSGTLPVYMGPPNIREHLPHPDSVILVQDFETMEELAAYLEKVSQNRTLYESHHAWRKQPLPESFHKKYDFTKIHSRCRICRFIYAKLHDDVVWNHDAQEIIRFPSAAEAAAAAPKYSRKSPVAVSASSTLSEIHEQSVLQHNDNVPKGQKTSARNKTARQWKGMHSIAS